MIGNIWVRLVEEYRSKYVSVKVAWRSIARFYIRYVYILEDDELNISEYISVHGKRNVCEMGFSRVPRNLDNTISHVERYLDNHLQRSYSCSDIAGAATTITGGWFPSVVEQWSIKMIVCPRK